MKKILIILSVFFIISCKKEEKESQIFSDYIKTYNVYELPDWLKGSWAVNRDYKDMCRCQLDNIDEKVIKSNYAHGNKENSDVWIRKTDYRFEIISKGDFSGGEGADPTVKAQEAYYLEIYEKVDIGIRYTVKIINKDGTCATKIAGNCEMGWKYYKKKTSK